MSVKRAREAARRTRIEFTLSTDTPDLASSEGAHPCPTTRTHEGVDDRDDEQLAPPLKRPATRHGALELARRGGVYARADPLHPWDLPASIAAGFELVDEQCDVVRTVGLRGANAVLTAAAGTGKTRVVHALVAYAAHNHVACAVTASTGAGAQLLHGTTLHSFAGFGMANDTPAGLAAYLARLGKVPRPPAVNAARAALLGTALLIVDEISMLPPFLLTWLDRGARAVRNCRAPFGGMQVLLVGDFLQLPPVIRAPRRARGRSPAGAAPVAPPSPMFATHTWSAARLVPLRLQRVHRQADPAFTRLLAGVRRGAVCAQDIALLRGRLCATPPPDVTHIVPRVAMVRRINALHMQRAIADPGFRGTVLDLHATAAIQTVHTTYRGARVRAAYLRRHTAQIHTDRAAKAVPLPPSLRREPEPDGTPTLRNKEAWIPRVQYGIQPSARSATGGKSKGAGVQQTKPQSTQRPSASTCTPEFGARWVMPGAGPWSMDATPLTTGKGKAGRTDMTAARGMTEGATVTPPVVHAWCQYAETLPDDLRRRAEGVVLDMYAHAGVHGPRHALSTVYTGAPVIVTHNIKDTDGILVAANGTRCTVCETQDVPGTLQVRTANGGVVAVQPVPVRTELAVQRCAIAVQQGPCMPGKAHLEVVTWHWPVVLAHAMTVHRAQGMTLDRIAVDLGPEVFEAQQAYVALSRARTLQGVYITDLDVDAVTRVNAVARAWDDAVCRRIADHAEQTRLGPQAQRIRAPERGPAVDSVGVVGAHNDSSAGTLSDSDDATSV